MTCPQSPAGILGLAKPLKVDVSQSMPVLAFSQTFVSAIICVGSVVTLALLLVSLAF